MAHLPASPCELCFPVHSIQTRAHHRKDQVYFWRKAGKALKSRGKPKKIQNEYSKKYNGKLKKMCGKPKEAYFFCGKPETVFGHHVSIISIDGSWLLEDRDRKLKKYRTNTTKNTTESWKKCAESQKKHTDPISPALVRGSGFIFSGLKMRGLRELVLCNITLQTPSCRAQSSLNPIINVWLIMMMTIICREVRRKVESIIAHVMISWVHPLYTAAWY